MIVIMFETHLKINDTITANSITADMIICGSYEIATSDSNTATNKSNKDWFSQWIICLDMGTRLFEGDLWFSVTLRRKFNSLLIPLTSKPLLCEIEIFSSNFHFYINKLWKNAWKEEIVCMGAKRGQFSFPSLAVKNIQVYNLVPVKGEKVFLLDQV